MSQIKLFRMGNNKQKVLKISSSTEKMIKIKDSLLVCTFSSKNNEIKVLGFNLKQVCSIDCKKIHFAPLTFVRSSENSTLIVVDKSNIISVWRKPPKFALFFVHKSQYNVFDSQVLTISNIETIFITHEKG